MVVRHYGVKHMIPEAKVPGLSKTEVSQFINLKKHHNKIFSSALPSLRFGRHLIRGQN